MSLIDAPGLITLLPDVLSLQPINAKPSRVGATGAVIDVSNAPEISWNLSVPSFTVKYACRIDELPIVNEIDFVAAE